MGRQTDTSVAANFDLEPWVIDGTGPGLVAAILSNGRVASWTSRGCSVEAGATLSPATVFYVASISKQFTAACITLCERDGLLEAGASIRRYVPELPPYFDAITVRHLLHHLAGLPHGGASGLSGSVRGENDWRDGLGLWDLVGLLALEPAPSNAPGEAYAYSNCGYWLLAAAVERISGQSFAAFARCRLFDELGMDDSRFRDDPDTPQPGLAPGHVYHDSRYRVVSTRFHGVGDGGLLTTLNDLAKWDTFWLGTSPLGPELPNLLLEQGRRNDGARLVYARGNSVREHRGERIVTHGGSFLGYQSKLVRFPDHGFSVCALANADVIDLDRLCIALADRVLGSRIDVRTPSWADTYREDVLAM